MIKSQLTLKQLEAFVCVADCGSFRKAAGQLGTTQPNISVRIAALEDTLGMVLMHRGAGAVRLTEPGTEILDAARQVLRASERLLTKAGRQDLVEERLRLGVTELVAATWLHDYLRAFKQAYPGIRVELTVNLSQDILSDMVSRNMDLAILNDVPADVPFRQIPLGEQPYGWVCTPEFARLLGDAPTIADVFEHPVLTHARSAHASRALAAFAKRKKLPVEQIAHSNSLTSCLHMAVDGMGVTLLPRQVYAAQVAEGRLVDIDLEWLPEPLQFCAAYDPARMPMFVQYAAELAVRFGASNDS